MTVKFSNKFSQKSPYISNTFSRESPKCQKGFHLSKRSRRRSKDFFFFFGVYLKFLVFIWRSECFGSDLLQWETDSLAGKWRCWECCCHDSFSVTWLIHMRHDSLAEMNNTWRIGRKQEQHNTCWEHDSWLIGRKQKQQNTCWECCCNTLQHQITKIFADGYEEQGP